jgi:AraC-like DNA-binding protein
VCCARHTPVAFGMPETARKLGMSVRKRLEEERRGSLRDLVDDARRDAADWMLRDPAVTIQAASYELGFASPSVFQRWTCMKPAHERAT